MTRLQIIHDAPTIQLEQVVEKFVELSPEILPLPRDRLFRLVLLAFETTLICGGVIAAILTWQVTW